MLLKYLSKPVQLAGVKLCNVSLGDFQTDAINVMLQKRKQKGWHTSKGGNENNPIISCRGTRGNFWLLGSSRDDSWYLKHVNDPWGTNVARKRKNTNNKAERQRESISQAEKKIHFVSKSKQWICENRLFLLHHVPVLSRPRRALV